MPARRSGTSVDGDAFEGGMKIKLGPIAMTFKGDGELRREGRDGPAGVLKAKGRDARATEAPRPRQRHPDEHDGSTASTSSPT